MKHSTTVTICNVRGLHARASAKFVQCVEKFDADVTVRRDEQSVGGTSIMGLMMLAAGPGVSLDISATGTDAVEVLEELKKLIDDGFGEVGELVADAPKP